MKIPACSLCPRRCAAPRGDASPGGYCRMPADAYVSRVGLHMWEEPPISGSRGSGAIFFSGCSLGCVFCQNHAISRAPVGRLYSPEDLADAFKKLEDMGAHNINLVTGTHFAHVIIAAMKIYRPRVPVVWNSGGYERECVVDALAPYIDIWLPDYKYALRETAEKYSGAPDYPIVALDALKAMRRLAPEDVYDSEGIMLRGVIVRHLVLPGNTRNSIAALRAIAEHLPGVAVSLMSQYTPAAPCGAFPELARRITGREYDKVCDELFRLDLDGFMQERSSSSESYIPAWDI